MPKTLKLKAPSSDWDWTRDGHPVKKAKKFQEFGEPIDSMRCQ